MQAPALSPSASIEWLDLRTYLDRQCELVWRMENKISVTTRTPTDRDQRMALFLAESVAASYYVRHVELMEAISNRLRIGVKTGDGPKNSWCFLFTPLGSDDPIFLDDLGNAFRWLRLRSETLRVLEA